MIRIVDLSVMLDNHVITDPPFMRPKITHQTHGETMAELNHSSPASRRTRRPTGPASPQLNGDADDA